jgi:hypothetical protein
MAAVLQNCITRRKNLDKPTQADRDELCAWANKYKDNEDDEDDEDDEEEHDEEEDDEDDEEEDEEYEEDEDEDEEDDEDDEEEDDEDDEDEKSLTKREPQSKLNDRISGGAKSLDWFLAFQYITHMHL